jgi:hypothetical protein
MTEMRQLEAQLSGQSNEVESLHEQLREVKASASVARDVALASRVVAEDAQRTAAAHLERVARLEAEFLALRTGPAALQTESPNTKRTSWFSSALLQQFIGWLCYEPPTGVVARLEFISAIVHDFSTISDDFKTKQFALLWRGSRDGFRARDFHSRCDGHPNTLTVILDTDGNIFGGFTPVKWESRVWNGKQGMEDNRPKVDPSLKSFLYTVKNPFNIPPRRFVLRAGTAPRAICCDSAWGPVFCGIGVSDECNPVPYSFAYEFRQNYNIDIGLDGGPIFTRSVYFQVKEIEVFEITG